ncbi:MAG TPA: NAD(P)-dependent oxidoreductase, partial [Dehalococcoidia bacterium]|nr:NAD(P)-dependent oxidoreductase [Dehalococcoidia bacterium]
MAIKQRVLVTGAAGQIGGIIRNKLGYRYELTGLDVVDHDYPTSHVADLSDLDAITPAFERQEVIV